jgi:3-deoxy-7-phosphoheptulonate synthase
MLIVMKAGSLPEDVDRIRRIIHELGSDTQAVTLGDRLGVRVLGANRVDLHAIAQRAEVEQLLPIGLPIRLAAAESEGIRSQVRVGAATIGDGFTLIAGPCAVETPEQLLGIAAAVSRSGAEILRGGAWKPRTSPYEFQGLGKAALELLDQARAETGLPIVTEAVDHESFDQVEAHAEMVQIGARNMQNYELLKRAGRSSRAILLKRGISATLDEWLMAAEYILEAGNPNVVLCERGIRTYSRHSRFTLDLSVVPVLRRITHLPIIVDPSHASGDRRSVVALARATAAVGADGVMVEVHDSPENARCDGRQSLSSDEFERLSRSIRLIEAAIDSPAEPVL